MRRERPYLPARVPDWLIEQTAAAAAADAAAAAAVAESVAAGCSQGCCWV